MNIAYWLLKFELERMTKFLDFSNEAMEQTNKEFKREIELAASDLPDNLRNDFYEFHSDEYAMLTDDFPRRFYSSFLVSWYSFVEDKLNKLCRKLKPTTGISDNEFSNLGKGIERSRRFLSKAIDYDIRQEYWQELTRINKIRNKIVHAGGKARFPESDSDISKYLMKHSLIVYHGVAVLNPSHDYCEHLVNFAKDLFSTIYDDLQL